MLRGGLVKTVNFKNPHYVGDPINAVKIFNEKKVDELVVLDITGRYDDNFEINYDLLKRIAASARMPLAYGGGVRDADAAARLVALGFEKVVVNTTALVSPELIPAIAATIGRQSVVVSVDYTYRDGGYRIYNPAIGSHGTDPIGFCKIIEQLGVGEIFACSVDRDGTMQGLDLDFALKLRRDISCPLTFCGGASSLEDIRQFISAVGVVGIGVGSLFIYKGRHRAVLLSYSNSI
jgi:cyclase